MVISVISGDYGDGHALMGFTTTSDLGSVSCAEARSSGKGEARETLEDGALA